MEKKRTIDGSNICIVPENIAQISENLLQWLADASELNDKMGLESNRDRQPATIFNNSKASR